MTTEQPDLTQADWAGALICYAKCEPCQYGSHYDEPQPHPWAGPDDIAHALLTGQERPTGNCSCHCATAP